MQAPFFDLMMTVDVFLQMNCRTIGKNELDNAGEFCILKLE